MSACPDMPRDSLSSFVQYGSNILALKCRPVRSRTLVPMFSTVARVRERTSSDSGFIPSTSSSHATLLTRDHVLPVPGPAMTLVLLEASASTTFLWSSSRPLRIVSLSDKAFSLSLVSLVRV